MHSILYVLQYVTWQKFNSSHSRDDLVRAIKKLKAMGNGFGMIPVGGSYLVQSVPAELNMDHTVVLQLAEVILRMSLNPRIHFPLWVPLTEHIKQPMVYGGFVSKAYKCFFAEKGLCDHQWDQGQFELGTRAGKSCCGELNYCLFEDMWSVTS